MNSPHTLDYFNYDYLPWLLEHVTLGLARSSDADHAIQSSGTCVKEAVKMKYIGLDKSGYQVYIFLISPWKHMLHVPIRSALPASNEYLQYYVFIEK